MIYIYSPGGFRKEIIHVLDSMGIDFTEDPRAALTGASKLVSAQRCFDYGKLRELLSGGAYHREISRRLVMPGATRWRYARLVPLEEIPEEHREFFAGYRQLVDAKGAIARITRKIGDEIGKERVHRVLEDEPCVPRGDVRRGRRSRVRSPLQGENHANESYAR